MLVAAEKVISARFLREPLKLATTTLEGIGSRESCAVSFVA